MPSLPNVPDYTAEPGVDPARNTETLAELVVEIDNWRWSGVPFRLRSGKAVRERRKETLITFKALPHLPIGLRGQPIPDQLRLSMGPDRMALEMNVNGPDDPLVLERIALDTDLTPGRLPAYGEVLAGVLDGDPLLSVRGDTAEECWRIVDPVLQAWRDGKVPMDEYAAGSDGPSDWSRTEEPSSGSRRQHCGYTRTVANDCPLLAWGGTWTPRFRELTCLGGWYEVRHLQEGCGSV
jgi:glucose-6-phosphate 1-dehydrogenase